jgi:hypothetical protein
MIAMKIVGYDHNTESLAVEVPVPADAVGAARVIANVPAADPDLLVSYPLTKDQVRQIAARFAQEEPGHQLSPDRRVEAANFLDLEPRPDPRIHLPRVGRHDPRLDSALAQSRRQAQRIGAASADFKTPRQEQHLQLGF